MSAEKPSPDSPIENPTATRKTLFPRTRATQVKTSFHEPTSDRPPYDPVDQTQDWVIEDGTLIKPPQKLK